MRLDCRVMERIRRPGRPQGALIAHPERGASGGVVLHGFSVVIQVAGFLLIGSGQLRALVSNLVQIAACFTATVFCHPWQRSAAVIWAERFGVCLR